MSDIEDDYSVSVGDGDVDSDAEQENYKKPTFLGKKKPTLSDDEDDDENNEEHGEDGEDENKNEDIEILEDEENDDDDEIEDDVDDDDDDDEIEDDDDADNHDDLYGGGDEDDEETKSSKLGGAKGDKNKAKQEKKTTTIQLDDVGNYEDDDEDYQDESYLQKFDKEMTKNYILDFHPECLSHNYDEIKALSKVTRDEFNIIIDPLHKTVPFLTKYEKARILGQRAKQIECGAKPLVKVPENIIDSYLIAELELEEKAMPFIIRRPIPSGGSEYWNLKDLEMISF